MMNPESTLEKANALMDRELNRPPRDPKIDAETVSVFIESLINSKVPSDMIKDLAIAYLMRL